MANKPCLHCDLIELIIKFVIAHPEYDKEEIVTDTMQVTGEIIQRMLDAGIKLDIPGVHVIKTENWVEGDGSTKH